MLMTSLQSADRETRRNLTTEPLQPHPQTERVIQDAIAEVEERMPKDQMPQFLPIHASVGSGMFQHGYRDGLASDLGEGFEEEER